MKKTSNRLLKISTKNSDNLSEGEEEKQESLKNTSKKETTLQKGSSNSINMLELKEEDSEGSNTPSRNNSVQKDNINFIEPINEASSINRQKSNNEEIKTIRILVKSDNSSDYGSQPGQDDSQGKGGREQSKKEGKEKGFVFSLTFNLLRFWSLESSIFSDLSS